jgi:hypothetical protein
MSRSIGNQEIKMDCQKGDSPGGFADISTPFSLKFLTKSGYSGTNSLNSLPSIYHCGNELAEIDGFGLNLRPIEEIKQQDHQQTDNEPKGDISIEGVQKRSLKH